MVRPCRVHYICRPLRSLWIVYRVAENGDEIRTGSYRTQEEARREAERLNGRQIRRNPDSWFEFFINSLK
nr:MAG TPA: hypothetical protein [Caudoviricetes sp.]